MDDPTRTPVSRTPETEVDGNVAPAPRAVPVSDDQPTDDRFGPPAVRPQPVVSDEQPIDDLFVPPAVRAAETTEHEEQPDSFATLLASSEAKRMAPDLEKGQRVEGTVVKLDDKMAFLDVGRKGEATIAIEELRDPDGTVTVAVGDKLTAFVVSTQGGVLLSRIMTTGPQSRSMLEEAAGSGMPVEGLVTGVNKGGLEIDVSGTRAFCPLSQIDLRFCENPAAYVGQRLKLRVTQYSEGGRKVVVSRRAILEEEAASVVGDIRNQLRVGAQLRGKVVSLRDFGAFVDLGGGIEGLIHVSELAHGHVTHAKDVLTVGQEVDVLVLRIEAPKEPKEPAKDADKKRRRAPVERIALSLKSLAEDPWATARAAFPEGTVVTGKVVRLQPFGAFVELAPGIDGLLHISNIVGDRKINHPKDVLAEGQMVEATVLSVHEGRKRIGLTLLSEADSRPAQGVSAASVGRLGQRRAGRRGRGRSHRGVRRLPAHRRRRARPHPERRDGHAEGGRPQEDVPARHAPARGRARARPVHRPHPSEPQGRRGRRSARRVRGLRAGLAEARRLRHLRGPPVEDEEVKSAVESLLLELYIAAPGARLRVEDRRKAAEVAAICERVAGLFRKPRRRTVVDLACGQGYLGIAIAHLLGGEVELWGVEREPKRVARCRDVARELGLVGARFEAADIGAAELPERPDLLVSLHACSGATDDAIARAAGLQARRVMIAPCCHARRAEGAPAGFPSSGVLRRRYDVLVTDAARFWTLEAAGYLVTVREFVAPTVSPENLLYEGRFIGPSNRSRRAREHLVQAGGFEPPFTGPKPAVLPLDDA